MSERAPWRLLQEQQKAAQQQKAFRGKNASVYKTTEITTVLPPQGVKNVTYIFGVPLCRVSRPWLYTTYIHIYVGCFTQIHKVNVKMLHYIFRLGKQIYKSNL